MLANVTVAVASLVCLVLVIFIHYEGLNHFSLHYARYKSASRRTVLLGVGAVFCLHLVEIWVFALMLWLLLMWSDCGSLSGPGADQPFGYCVLCLHDLHDRRHRRSGAGGRDSFCGRPDRTHRVPDDYLVGVVHLFGNAALLAPKALMPVWLAIMVALPMWECRCVLSSCLDRPRSRWMHRRGRRPV